ncbi:MAG: hypothetical protein EOO66_30230 [Methylobacterium sp.]|nr:MAG: hypothetical protein EOO66_30230 [Methylobacterium sp.]
MRNLMRIGLFVAAGYGTYEILRRAGVLDKAGQWLQDNVPEDVKAKVRDHMQQARDQAQHLKDQAQTLKGQAGEQIGSLRGQAQEQYQNLRTRATEGYSAARQQVGERIGQAREAVTNKLHGGQESADAPQGEASRPSVPNEPVAEEYDSAHSTDASGIGQTITGPGRGTDDATAEVNGGTVHHRVGRGVIHG